MIKKIISASLMLFCVQSILIAQQPCNLVLSGQVICSDDGKSVFAATVGIPGTNKFSQTDEQGKFSISGLCAGKIKIQVLEIGYSALDTTLDLINDLTVKFYLKPLSIHLSEVSVEEHKVNKQQIETATVDELKPRQLDQIRGETLGDIAKEITGVNVIKSGSTVTKPVIHGLHSNRILILNNGVRQEGQQWGSEHAPEIDPFIATKLSVIKGAASIRYGSDAIGGVVLLEPPPLPVEKSVSGEVNLVGMSNGWLYCGSGILQGAFDKKLKGLSWRAQGTYKRSGNLKAPDYYLDNTGVEEKNFSAALGYNREKYGFDFYYSRFNTQIGIYTGSHVGNPQELLATFNGEKKVEDYGFSYTIKRGYQLVNHNLFKAHGFINLNHAGKIDLDYAWQKDIRQEFDFHVPYTSNGVDLSNYPQVYFQLITSTANAIWEHPAWLHITGSIGASYMTQGNVFKGLTYRSLIPNFRNYGGGLFVIEKRNWSRLTLEAGARFDYKWQREYLLNATTLETETPTEDYKNISFSAGALYHFTSRLSATLNSGSAWRAPSVYELYVSGIHGSLSTYEVGDQTMISERAYNNTFSLKYNSEKLTGELGLYINYIKNYIFLEPQPGKYAVTYSGTFPLFYFKQTDALFKGIDFDFSYTFFKHLKFESHEALVFADNLKLDAPLILIPPPSFRNNISWEFGDAKKITGSFIMVENYSVVKQWRTPGPNSDFVPPPDGYSLLSVRMGATFIAGKQPIIITVGCENMLNTVYRDYLNLFRYYADEPGVNFTLRIKIPFSIIKSQTNEN